MSSMSKQETLLNDCYLIMATIIRDGGTIYLPIFKRLHHEKSQMQSDRELIQFALQASDNLLG